MLTKTFAVAIPSIQVVFFNNELFELLKETVNVAIPSIQVVFFNEPTTPGLQGLVRGRNPFYSGRFFQ